MPSNCPRNRFGPSRPRPRRKSNTTLPPGRLYCQRYAWWFCPRPSAVCTSTGIIRLTITPADQLSPYCRDPAGTDSSPAHEIESRITERLQAFLRSDAQVFEELNVSAESHAVLHHLVGGAKKVAARVSALPANDLRDLLACILQRVIIQENNIQVMIRKS